MLINQDISPDWVGTFFVSIIFILPDFLSQVSGLWVCISTFAFLVEFAQKKITCPESFVC